MPTTAGQTGNYTLSINTPTQVALLNNSRKYMRVQNEDAVNSIRYAFGTNNGASVTPPVGHLLPPMQYSEFVGPLLPQGDVSAIALSGNPTISWIEE